jgi:hypothetical protein
MGKMSKGFYRGVEPVAVVSISDVDSLRKALAAMIMRGNPTVPMLRRREWCPPILLKYAGVKFWSAFERGVGFWSLEKRDGIFRIAVKKIPAECGATIRIKSLASRLARRLTR